MIQPSNIEPAKKLDLTTKTVKKRTLHTGRLPATNSTFPLTCANPFLGPAAFHFPISRTTKSEP